MKSRLKRLYLGLRGLCLLVLFGRGSSSSSSLVSSSSLGWSWVGTTRLSDVSLAGSKVVGIY